MHMGRPLPEENAWHSHTNGPSIPPVVPQPPVPVVQPTGPPSDAEFEMLQNRIQSMDPIIVWNLVRIKILPNFSPWDFLCDRTRLCGPKHGQNNGGNKLPTSVAKLKFLLQEMNDLAEELSHLVDNCCDIIDDSDNEEESEEPEEMEDINEEDQPDTEKKPEVEEKTEEDGDKSEAGVEQIEKETTETTIEDEKNEKEKDIEEEKSSTPAESESEPMNTESDPKPDTENTTEATPTVNGNVDGSENSIDSNINNAEKDESNSTDKPIENDVEPSNSESQKEQPTDEENKVVFLYNNIQCV